ncbi:MAG: hypothetical protein H6707_14715 [Deltaproteobacteria bacterium]|nr:hypothetical protein [Deltaproteobacteria bacterium]
MLRLKGPILGLLCVFTIACSDNGAARDSGTALDSATTDLKSGLGDSFSGDGAVFGCGFDGQLPFSPMGETLQFESKDRQTCVLAKRRNDSIPGDIYKAVPYTLLSMRVGHDGNAETISDPAKLKWTSTHHNWYDEGEATGGALIYTLAYSFDVNGNGGLMFAVTAKDLQGKAVWGPVTLFGLNAQTTP